MIHPHFQRIFQQSPVQAPERVADGWPDELLASSDAIAEHLRQALPTFVSDAEIADNRALGRAYVFCQEDPHTHRPGRCIYTTRIKPDTPDMNALEGMAMSGLMGMVMRGLASWGRAEAAALISTAQLCAPGERAPRTPAELGRVNAWMISVARKGHGTTTYVSVDRYRGPGAELPRFDVYDQQVVDLFGFAKVLDPLPDLTALVRAQDATAMSMSDLVHACDHRDRLRVALVMESQASLHLDLPVRHRLRVLTIDTQAHGSIGDVEGQWHLYPEHVRVEAERARGPLTELGLLMQPNEAAAAPPPERRH